MVLMIKVGWRKLDQTQSRKQLIEDSGRGENGKINVKVGKENVKGREGKIIGRSG